MEVSEFVYCLLSRTRKIGSLPELNNWEEYMDSEKAEEIEDFAAVDFLRNHPFGSTLRSRKDGEIRAFREQCRKFMHRLEETILLQQPVTGEFSHGFYAFCLELLLEGDDYNMLDLFRKLVHVLDSSGSILSSESKTAVEEYSTFVVDARRRHGSGCTSAEDIADVRHYLLSDYSFLSCKGLCRVFKLCCLVVLKPRCDFPAVHIDLAGVQVPEWVVTTCVCVGCRLVFKLGSCFTIGIKKIVRESINASRAIM